MNITTIHHFLLLSDLIFELFYYLSHREIEEDQDVYRLLQDVIDLLYRTYSDFFLKMGGTESTTRLHVRCSTSMYILTSRNLLERERAPLAALSRSLSGRGQVILRTFNTEYVRLRIPHLLHRLTTADRHRQHPCSL